ncbi:rod shape-determining protein MreD [Paracoccus aestuarii]|uniref:Rod shape-determining protein MreD n=1 Tax=Paracoccus aestuarii TaxID=453842 RepID=A0A418ZTS4_9RHOB|nr:rod shape-determining protein MreD [Paracoccus aestuarii]RJL01904.1 rod shape-determining protein MreD [Paracoccus aestuarii]WCQ99692.1 rod shape-determining protein MreD [Paracoccus aestuarii]
MIGLPSRAFVTGTLLFLGCVWLLLFIRLLPLSRGVTGWPGPDLAVPLILAWVLRRPDQLAAPVIVLALLVEDLLLMRPLGLWTAIVLLGSEAARLREPRWRDQPFMVEWLRVGILIGVMMLAYRFVQVLFLLPVAALGQVILQYLATVAAYPAVVFGARWLIGLRRPPRRDAV